MHVDLHDPMPLLAAPAGPTRLRLLQAQVGQPEDRPPCANAPAARPGVSQPAISLQLRGLRSPGLVQAERRGARVHGFVDGPRLLRWRRLAGEARTPAGAGDARAPEAKRPPAGHEHGH